MYTTGNSFSDYLFWGITFLPLLPAFLILVRRLYGQEPFNFLAVICLLGFFQSLLGMIYPVQAKDQYPAGRIVTLLLYTFFFLTFRSNLGGKFRYALNLLMTSLLSVLGTYWYLKGWDGSNPAIDLFLNGFLALLIGVSLRKIIRNDELGVFSHPLFWIEGGTLFYILLSLILEGVAACYLPTAPGFEKRLFLGLADLVRYIAYVAAILLL
jgi:hypothetical protein